MNPKHRRYQVGCILLMTWGLLFGAPLNPLIISDQVWRRINPPSLLDPDSLVIGELNHVFETFFRKYHQPFGMSQSWVRLDPHFAEIKSIELFIELHIEYNSDFNQYLTYNHLATDVEIARTGSDDCDGRAILATSLLLHRGYDAWVLVGPRHYSVGVILGSGHTLYILQETGTRWWVFRFNNIQTIYNWPIIFGKMIEGTFLAFIFLTVILSILNRETLYRKIIVLLAYLGFLTVYLVFV